MASREIKYGDYVCKYTTLKTDVVNVMDGFAVIGTDVTQRISGVVVSDTEANLGTAMSTFYKAFAKPRQQFTIIANSASWYDIKYDEADQSQDIHFGPIVESANIESYLGRLAFTYTVAIKYRIKICDSTPLINNILRLKKDESFTIDINGFTRRLTEGHIIVTHQSRPADKYRTQLKVEIEKGFKRIHQNFKTSDDGCRMDYQIVDEELYWQLPNPITSGVVDFNVTMINSGLMHASLKGQLAIGPNTKKDEVIKVIQTLHDSYFKKVWPEITKSINISNSINTSVYGNTVDFSFEKQGSGELGNVSDMSGFFSNLGVIVSTPPGNAKDEVQIAIPPYGLGDLTIGAAGRIAHKLIPNNCDNTTTSPGSTPTGTTQPPTSPGTSPTSPANLTTGLTSEHVSYPYLEYGEKLSFDTDNNIKVYYPIVAGVNPIVQQTRQAKTFVTQTGYATRANKQPEIPAPLLNQQKPLQQNIEFGIPIRMQGQLTYSANWRYIMQVQQSAIGINGSQLPQDPRYSTASPVVAEAGKYDAALVK